MESVLAQLTNWITSLLQTTGYLGIIFLIALENIFPPIPSEVILPLTGYLVYQDKLNVFAAIISATIGSVLGALFLYYLSRKLGKKRVLSLADKYGRILGISKEDVEKSLTLFHKHGGKLIFFGRIVPTIRSVVSIPAGLTGMDIKKFILFSALGSALWNGTLIGIGLALGERWQEIQKYTKVLEYVVWVVVIGGILWLLWRKYKKRK